MIKQLYSEIQQWASDTYKKPGIEEVRRDFSNQYVESSPLTKRILFGAVIVLIIAAGYWLSYSAWNTPKIARMLTLPVPVGGYRVRVDEIANTVGASGTVQEHSTIMAASLVAAEVQDVLVNIGDLIKKGQPLINIDQSFYAPALESAKQQELAAHLNVQKATAILNATKELRNQHLAEDVDIQTASSSLATASQAQAEAQELVAQAQRNLNFTHMASPVNGIVITRNVEPGDNLTINSPVFTLGDLDSVYFGALVQEDDLPFLNKGAPADVVFSSLPTQKFEGTVEKIEPTVDSSTRTFSAYITIKNPNLSLRPGITGFARIIVKRTGLTIPQTAVMNQFGETASVFVVNQDSRAVLTPVHLGLLGGDGIYEVISGLKEGDVVVSVGTLYLKNNERVHVTFPNTKS